MARGAQPLAHSPSELAGAPGAYFQCSAVLRCRQASGTRPIVHFWRSERTAVDAAAIGRGGVVAGLLCHVCAAATPLADLWGLERPC